MGPYKLIVSCLLLALVLTGCQPQNSPEGGKIQITATFYPVADIVKQVGGDKVEVATLLPTGADIHNFMPTMAQIKQLNRAHLVLRVGYGADPYLDTVMKSVDNPNTKLIEISKRATLLPLQDSLGEHGHHDEHAGSVYDPHLWLSLNNLKQMVINTADALSIERPSDKAYFQQRKETLLKKLTVMQQQALRLRSTWKAPNYIAVHAAFRYLNNDFGLKQVGVFEPKPGVETSARELRQLIDDAKRLKVKCVFVAAEEQHKLANSVAGDLGLPIYTLDVCTQPQSADDPGIIIRMQKNINVIKKAMQ